MPTESTPPFSLRESFVSAQQDITESNNVLARRAKQVAESKAEFPRLKELLAGQIVVNAQSQETENLGIVKQLIQASLIPGQMDTARQLLDAESAVAVAGLAFNNAEALLTRVAMEDFIVVLGALNSATGIGPSTAPSVPEGSSVPAGLSYQSYLKAMDAVLVFGARFGSLPLVAPAMRLLDERLDAITNAYRLHILAQISRYYAAIASATSEAELLTLAADPQFQFAAHNPQWNTDLRKEYRDRWTQLQSSTS